MRLAIAVSIALCAPLAACVKAPHEVPLAYEEFDKAPDYVWREYSSAHEDEARVAYWEGYRSWLCPQVVGADGKWLEGELSSVQRRVACGEVQRERRRLAKNLRDESFQEGLAEVELGMEPEQVLQLLGRPARIDQSDDPTDTDAHWIYRDASRKRTVLRLHFREGRLEALAE